MIKDVPIKLPCGSEVKLGMRVYTVTKHSIGKYCINFKPWSGVSRAKVVEHRVISVNTLSGARTFTIQSEKGSEQTYSVKNNCFVETVFSKKSDAKKYAKDIDMEDIRIINCRIKENEDHIKKCKATIMKIRKAKH